jgi:hypothetical protein
MAKLAPPPPTNQDVSSRQFRDWFYSVFQFINQQTGILGTMAYENANSVAITGGSIGGVGITGSTINNTPIGNTTPSTISGTTISATGQFNGSGVGLTNIPYTGITGLATVAHTGAYSDLTGTPTGLSVTITTAKLTPTGTNGSMTFTNGILTAQTQAT